MSNYKYFIQKGLLFSSLLLLFTSAGAETRYITDQFEVTLRSGTSTSNSIISMLKSGQAVNLIEQDEDTRYSLVETESGKRGYVLTRYLDAQSSGRARLAVAQNRNSQLDSTIKNLRTELNQFKTTKREDDAMIKNLEGSLDKTTREFQELSEATRDTTRVLQQNDSLKARINELEADKLRLSEENTMYKDSTAMDWFIRGAGVSLAAFLLGIIVTRIRWKKRDSWGSY